jgi:glycosyltransferase involved in cell wall biosynthesis
MACGTPVVTTSRTLASLGVTPGRELMAADGADEFSQKVLELLDDQALLSKIGEAGADYVKEYHSWIAMTEKMLGYYSETIDGGRKMPT